MDTLINYGGAVKTLGDGRVEGYLIVFGDPQSTDISAQRDYFTPDTDFDIRDGAKTAIWYLHGLDSTLDVKIGEGELKTDTVGVWVSAQLDLRNRYCAAVYDKMAAKGALGWSSGTATHLVQREKQANGAHKITRWPLGLDASLTPAPAEPRTQAVTAMKSLEPEALLPELLGEETPSASATPQEAYKTLLGAGRPDALADHSAVVVSAVADLAERLESRLEARKTDGRSLSAANRDALKSALGSLAELDAVKARLSRTLAASEPAPHDTPSADELQRQTEALRLRARATLAGYGYHARN